MSELTPYICVEDGRAAIEWYVAAQGAEATAGSSTSGCRAKPSSG